MTNREAEVLPPPLCKQDSTNIYRVWLMVGWKGL